MAFIKSVWATSKGVVFLMEHAGIKFVFLLTEKCSDSAQYDNENDLSDEKVVECFVSETYEICPTCVCVQSIKVVLDTLKKLEGEFATTKALLELINMLTEAFVKHCTKYNVQLDSSIPQLVNQFYLFCVDKYLLDWNEN